VYVSWGETFIPSLKYKDVLLFIFSNVSEEANIGIMPDKTMDKNFQK